ncbi:SH3 domain-containing protein [Shimia isoporae]|uniref:SH3 domain-containing protein n=1 Tax=Shimia isoporae TaxID=647720 RepID=UPI00140501F6|nr:SH3 domain-containing protein [Shimia isoporae]
MNKFVVVSFAFMGWAFYELSGGSDFEPTYRRDVVEAQSQKSPVTPEPARITATPIEPVVTKAAAVVPTVQRKEEAIVETVAAPTSVQTPLLAVDASTTANFATPQGSTPSLTDALSDKVIETQPALIKLGETTLILPEVKKDFRSVNGSRVNLRGGPGTSFGVLGVLVRDQEVEVLRDEGKGWVKLRDQETGKVGWMAAKMLSPLPSE